MPTVPLDKDFDKKIVAGAEALMKQWDVNPDNRKSILPVARADARAVLLAAMNLPPEKKVKEKKSKRQI